MSQIRRNDSHEYLHESLIRVFVLTQRVLSTTVATAASDSRRSCCPRTMVTFYEATSRSGVISSSAGLLWSMSTLTTAASNLTARLLALTAVASCDSGGGWNGICLS